MHYLIHPQVHFFLFILWPSVQSHLLINSRPVALKYRLCFCLPALPLYKLSSTHSLGYHPLALVYHYGHCILVIPPLMGLTIYSIKTQKILWQLGHLLCYPSLWNIRWTFFNIASVWVEYCLFIIAGKWQISSLTITKWLPIGHHGLSEISVIIGLDWCHNYAYQISTFFWLSESP